MRLSQDGLKWSGWVEKSKTKQNKTKKKTLFNYHTKLWYDTVTLREFTFLEKMHGTLLLHGGKIYNPVCVLF